MKHHLIALAMVALLAACSDKPRGPLEVQGQVFMDRKLPVQFEFLGREKGRVTNFDMDVRTDFSYTLEGEKLVLRIPGRDGKPEEVVTLALDGKRYSGGPLNLYTKDAGDEERIKQIQENTRARAEIAKKLSPKGAPSDRAAYRLNTELGDENNDWGAWVAAAWGKPMDDDELLRMFSKKWRSTEDSFDRKGMRAAELERIKQRLEQVRKVEFIAVPTEPSGVASILVLLNQPYGQEAYDFGKKSFHANSAACDGSNFVTRSNSSFRPNADKTFCWLPVADEAVARRIETSRASSKGVVVRNTAYAKVVGVQSNYVQLVTVGMDYRVYEQTYQEPKPEDLLAEVAHWPYQ